MYGIEWVMEWYKGRGRAVPHQIILEPYYNVGVTRLDHNPYWEKA